MTAPVSRSSLDRFARGLAEFRKRQAKAEQGQRGWYDENGVRQGGLIAFVRHFWHVLEPETPFVDGWVLWAMCEHLEAVTFGDLTRALINVPPGSMKSLLTDAFWPAWEWGPMGLAHLRYVTFSYSASLTERDNDRFGDLVSCPEYQALWGDRFRLTAKGKVKVANTKKGWKLASSVGGVATGERGDRIILDDPHNVKDIESETVRQETVRWFRESMSNRLNDLKRGAIVVIMQRLHDEDISGTILSLGLAYCHLCVAMEYEVDRQFNDDGSVRRNLLGWIDPRFDEEDPDSTDGELAWPERFPSDEIATKKLEMGPYAYAGQYQQNPVPRGGAIFKRDWWQLYESTTGKFPVFDLLIASLDSAFTEKEQNDPSALTVWGVFRTEEGAKRIMLVHAWRKHLEFSGPRIPMKPRETAAQYRLRTMPTWGLMEWTVDTCRRFKVDRLLIEAKASGISAAQELQNRYSREAFSVQPCPVAGDKVARALAVQPTFSQQLVFAPSREWSEMVIEEMEVFPRGKYKDLTDSATQAIKYLRDNGLAQTDEETAAGDADRVTHRARVKALYPV